MAMLPLVFLVSTATTGKPKVEPMSSVRHIRKLYLRLITLKAELMENASIVGAKIL